MAELGNKVARPATANIARRDSRPGNEYIGAELYELSTAQLELIVNTLTAPADPSTDVSRSTTTTATKLER